MLIPINSLVLQSGWLPSGETNTGIVLFQSLPELNQNDCQFVVRLKYGLNGLETPIYTETKSVFLEPGSSVLIDFRGLVPESFSFNNPDTRWVIETRLGFNFSPITVDLKEVSALSTEQDLILAALNGKADKAHTHLTSDITDLDTVLNSKLSKPTESPLAGQVLTAVDADTWAWTNPSGGSITDEYVSSVNGLTGDVTLPSYQLATYEQDGLIDARTAGVLNPQWQSISDRFVMVLANENRPQLIGSDEYSFSKMTGFIPWHQSGMIIGAWQEYVFNIASATTNGTLEFLLSSRDVTPTRSKLTSLTAGTIRLKPNDPAHLITVVNVTNGTRLTGQTQYLLTTNKSIDLIDTAGNFSDRWIILIGA